MHPIQKAILQLFGDSKAIHLKLRSIAREVGERHPQKIKYHLLQLEKLGMIAIDQDKKEILKIDTEVQGDVFVSLPIMGAANCGSATALAEDRVEGFLKMSRTLLPKTHAESLFVLRASGDSMNNLSDSRLEDKTIEDGDYIVIEKTDQAPNNKDIVVSIIDGYANVKRFFHQGDQIALISESKHEYPPIFIHGDDADKYHVVGRVVKIIKNPRFEP